MNHYLIAPLFFFFGALASWLFFAWKMDRAESKYLRDESKYLDAISDLQERNVILEMRVYNLKHPEKEKCQE